MDNVMLVSKEIFGKVEEQTISPLKTTASHVFKSAQATAAPLFHNCPIDRMSSGWCVDFVVHSPAPYPPYHSNKYDAALPYDGKPDHHPAAAMAMAIHFMERTSAKLIVVQVVWHRRRLLPPLRAAAASKVT